MAPRSHLAPHQARLYRLWAFYPVSRMQEPQWQPQPASPPAPFLAVRPASPVLALPTASPGKARSTLQEPSAPQNLHPPLPAQNPDDRANFRPDPNLSLYSVPATPAGLAEVAYRAGRACIREPAAQRGETP